MKGEFFSALFTGAFLTSIALAEKVAKVKRKFKKGVINMSERMEIVCQRQAIVPIDNCVDCPGIKKVERLIRTEGLRPSEARDVVARENCPSGMRPIIGNLTGDIRVRPVAM